MPSLSTESSSGAVHAGHAAAMMAAGLNGNVAAPLPLEAEERPAKRPRTGNRMVRHCHITARFSAVHCCCAPRRAPAPATAWSGR